MKPLYGAENYLPDSCASLLEYALQTHIWRMVINARPRSSEAESFAAAFDERSSCRVLRRVGIMAGRLLVRVGLKWNYR